MQIFVNFRESANTKLVLVPGLVWGARHLDDGKALKSKLPLFYGNYKEELG